MSGSESAQAINGLTSALQEVHGTFNQQNSLNEASRQTMLTGFEEKKTELESQVAGFVEDAKSQWKDDIEESSGRLVRYVNNNAEPGGDGSGSTPFNSLEVALDSIKDGHSYRFWLIAGQDYSIEGVDDELHTFTKSNVDIEFFSTDNSMETNILVPTFVHANGYYYPRWKFNAGNRFNLVLTGVKLKAIKEDPAIEGNSLTYSGFINPQKGCHLTLSIEGEEVFIDEGISLVTPYYAAASVNIWIRNVSVLGGGNLINTTYHNLCNIYASALSIADDTYLVTLKKPTADHIVTNYDGDQLNRN